MPGAGKTTLAYELVNQFKAHNKTVIWHNADIIRKEFDDWDFTPEGRLRQVKRMRDMADKSGVDFAICDFVCPTDEYRKVFDADIVVWLDTITQGRFEDTNKVFVPPDQYDFRVTEQDSKKWAKKIISELGVKSGDTNLRSLTKAISWRMTGTADTFIVSWLITGTLTLATGIALTEIFTKVFLFWFHERIWNNITWQKN